MNRIDYTLYKEQFDKVYAGLPEDIKASRYKTSQAIRLTLDKWCRKTFSVKYNILKENKIFMYHMTERFNQALEEALER